MELKIQKLTKTYDKKIAVDHVSATFEPGIIGLLGANGSGKTTLMRMIVDVLKPTNGNIYWNGDDIHANIEDYLSSIGYLPQQVGAYPSFRVDEFLAYMGALKGLKPAYTKQRIEILLKELHLVDQKKKKIKTLSGGMKQRLGIAQAMLNDPDILILDEPTVGLDPKERNQFAMLLSTICEHKIILLSTHIVTDIENIAHKVLIMKEGNFIDYDTPENLLSELAGKVYEIQVPFQQLKEFQKNYIITNQKNIGAFSHLRYIANQQVAGAISVEPTLNDVYLYHFQEESLC